jgi:hypothetical protein
MQVSPQRHDRLRRRRRAARRLAARRAAEATRATELTGVTEVPAEGEKPKATEPGQKGTVVTGRPRIPAQRSQPVRPGMLGNSQPAVDRP